MLPVPAFYQVTHDNMAARSFYTCHPSLHIIPVYHNSSYNVLSRAPLVAQW